MQDLNRLLGKNVFVHRFVRGSEIFWYGELSKDEEKYVIPNPSIASDRHSTALAFAGVPPSVLIREGDILVCEGQSYIA